MSNLDQPAVQRLVSARERLRDELSKVIVGPGGGDRRDC